MIQLTLTLKMTTAQVVEASVTVNNNSPIQDYVCPDDQTQPTFEYLWLLCLLKLLTKAYIFGSLTIVWEKLLLIWFVLFCLSIQDPSSEVSLCVWPILQKKSNQQRYVISFLFCLFFSSTCFCQFSLCN